LDVFTSMLPDSVVGPVGRARAELDDGVVQGLADPGDHLEGQVLVAALDPVDRALAGVQHVGELLLRPAAVLARVADQGADAAQVVVVHAGQRNARYEISRKTRGVWRVRVARQATGESPFRWCR
jgi:hypothetical protein